MDQKTYPLVIIPLMVLVGVGGGLVLYNPTIPTIQEDPMAGVEDVETVCSEYTITDRKDNEGGLTCDVTFSSGTLPASKETEFYYSVGDGEGETESQGNLMIDGEGDTLVSSISSTAENLTICIEKVRDDEVLKSKCHQSDFEPPEISIDIKQQRPEDTITGVEDTATPVIENTGEVELDLAVSIPQHKLQDGSGNTLEPLHPYEVPEEGSDRSVTGLFSISDLPRGGEREVTVQAHRVDLVHDTRNIAPNQGPEGISLNDGLRVDGREVQQFPQKEEQLRVRAGDAIDKNITIESDFQELRSELQSGDTT